MKSEAKDSFYNVGTGIRTSLKELAETLITLSNSDTNIEYKKRDQSTFVKNRIGCPLKAKEEIGFEAQIKLQDGLERLIKWRRNHKREVELRRMDE